MAIDIEIIIYGGYSLGKINLTLKYFLLWSYIKLPSRFIYSYGKKNKVERERELIGFLSMSQPCVPAM